MLDKLRHTAEVAKFKTNQMMKVSKVQGEIEKLKGEIDKLRIQIGDQVLALRAAGTPIPQLEETCAAVDALQAQIQQKLAEVEAIKAEQPPAGPPQCPNCQTVLQPGAAFCPKCGATLAAPPPPPPPPQAAPAANCPQCGTPVVPGNAFCMNCGTKLG